MPFPDELARGLAVVAYDRRWPGDFAVLAERIHGALGPVAVRVSHVGSTSVPGLAAKDCIDVQVEVQALDEEPVADGFAGIGFRLRPEPWNRAEPVPGGACPKLVFAPPVGERASNVHVLEAGSEAARRKLLFRDFLRAHDTARNAWGDFKQRLTALGADIYQYGQAKAGPTQILLIAAESWARQTRWAPHAELPPEERTQSSPRSAADGQRVGRPSFWTLVLRRVPVVDVLHVGTSCLPWELPRTSREWREAGCLAATGGSCTW